VIVVPGYYGCSNLCSLVLAALHRALAQAAIVPGRDAEVVVVSIAPLETPAMAAAREAAVLGRADVPGWHFLTGPEASIDALTRTLGFRAVYDAATASFGHPTGIAVFTPAGTLRTLLPGIDFAPAALRAAVADARNASPPAGAPGAAASTAADAGASPARWLLCLHDAIANGRYNAQAMAAVRAVALAALAGLAAMMLGRRRGTRPPEARRAAMHEDPSR
jgi:protein SCO1/2